MNDQIQDSSKPRPRRAASKPRKKIQSPVKKKVIAPVTMSAEDRHMYELEAAMVWYGTIIENKFARGEEITD